MSEAASTARITARESGWFVDPLPLAGVLSAMTLGVWLPGRILRRLKGVSEGIHVV
jgi:hypothetical protein